VSLSPENAAERGTLAVDKTGVLYRMTSGAETPLTRDEWLWLMLVAAPAAIFALGPDGFDRRGDARVVGLKDAPGGAVGTPPDAQVTIFEELADSGSS
jgi:hypothetical protein